MARDELPHDRRHRVPDTLLGCAAAGLLVLDAAYLSERVATPGPLGYVLLVSGGLALILCRRYPLPVLLLVTGIMAVVAIRLHPGPSAGTPVLVAVHFAARAGHRGQALLASLAFMCAPLAVALSDGPLGPSVPAIGRDTAGRPYQDILPLIVLLPGWFVAVIVRAQMTRHREAYLKQVEQRAVDAERTREEAALHRAGQERLRIARELHDSLTHSISIVRLQASVAVHLARKRGEQVPEALLAIQEASGEAMRELRATLEVLREDGSGPRHGLARIEALVARSRAAGLEVTVTVDGERRPLPPEADRAVYRIVQEALTNIARHAGPTATAEVHIRYAERELRVRVTDDGRASADRAAAPGTGLIGMRERVAALGGRLRAGPRAEGGFAVHADIPLPSPLERV